MPQAERPRWPSFRMLRPEPKKPSDAEVEDNPRARSAKLRAAVRTETEAWPLSKALAPEPGVRALAEVG
jgi:16S rRNA (cytosine1402-N4)-methyltransferase